MQKGYEVEDVVSKKIVNGEVMYRIKWVGYSSRQNTWEPAHHLSQELIDFYEVAELQRLKKKQKREQRKQNPSVFQENKPQAVIESHKLVNSTLYFTISKWGKRKELTRDQTLQQYSDQLVKYYIDLAKKMGKY